MRLVWWFGGMQVPFSCISLLVFWILGPKIDRMSLWTSVNSAADSIKSSSDELELWSLIMTVAADYE